MKKELKKEYRELIKIMGMKMIWKLYFIRGNEPLLLAALIRFERDEKLIADSRKMNVSALAKKYCLSEQGVTDILSKQ